MRKRELCCQGLLQGGNGWKKQVMALSGTVEKMLNGKKVENSRGLTENGLSIYP